MLFQTIQGPIPGVFEGGGGLDEALNGDEDVLKCHRLGGSGGIFPEFVGICKLVQYGGFWGKFTALYSKGGGVTTMTPLSVWTRVKLQL